MSAVSALTREQRHQARDIAVKAALLGLHHAASLHYTEGADRWQGIDDKLNAAKGHYPTHADCSSFVTWCLWNALHLTFGLPDTVNGANWTAGYTGTLAQHGVEVVHGKQIVLKGDLVLYGPAPTFEHTAIVVGHEDGKPVVVSNGSEPGPFLLPFDYRSDANAFRRYI